MNRLSIVFLSLAIASCDTSMKTTDGTSSETQTSLRALATRLDGMRIGAVTGGAPAVAARSAGNDADSSTWTDIWGLWTDVSYMVDSGNRIFYRISDSNVFTSANSYVSVQTERLVNQYAMSEARVWQWNRSCADSLEPPPYCIAAVPGTRQMSWVRTVFRNGVVLTPTDSDVNVSNGHILDGRWTIRESYGYRSEDMEHVWWDVFEGGHLIGHGRQQGRAFISSLAGDSYYNALSTMAIFDLADNLIQPDRTQSMTRVAFPEDSLGLSIDSSRIDRAQDLLHLRFSWRFEPGPDVPLDHLAEFRIAVCDSTLEGSGDWCSSFSRTFQLNTNEGGSIMAIPLDSILIAKPTTISILLSSQIDTLVGSRAQTRRIFHAAATALYPKLSP